MVERVVVEGIGGGGVALSEGGVAGAVMGAMEASEAAVAEVRVAVVGTVGHATAEPAGREEEGVMGATVGEAMVMAEVVVAAVAEVVEAVEVTVGTEATAEVRAVEVGIVVPWPGVPARWKAAEKKDMVEAVMA